MKKMGVFLGLALIMAVSVSCGNKKNGVSADATGSSSEQSFDGAASALQKGVPAVNLLDVVCVWPRNGSDLADKPFEERLDIGSAVTYNGKENQFGKNKYTYAEISTPKGTTGYVSSYRIAVDAVPVVVMEDTFLYSLPDSTCPTATRVSAGQIAGAYLNTGLVNGFAKISYCVYYGSQKYSDRYDGFVQSGCLSQGTDDIECAQFMVRAVENPDQWKDFAKFALESESTLNRPVENVFDVPAYSFDGKTAPAVDAAPIDLHEVESITVNAIPVVMNGALTQWYPISVNGTPAVVKIDGTNGAAFLKNVAQYQLSLENRTFRGDSVILIQNLALYAENKDDRDKLEWKASLNMGEVVSTSDNTKNKDKVTYVQITRCDGTTGWANTTFVSKASFPAAMQNKNEVKAFKEPKKLSVIANYTVPNYQIVAVNKDIAPTGWYSVSYYDQNAKRLMSDVYICDEGDFSLNTGDRLNAAILLNKLRASETEKFSDASHKESYQQCLATLISKQGGDYIAAEEYAKYLPAMPEQPVSSEKTEEVNLPEENIEVTE